MKRILTAAAFCLLPVSSLGATLGSFTDLIVFGDSLSDPGNLFGDLYGGVSPLPGLYGNGQFTDGDTWATQLGADVGSGTNFAYGGATAALSGPSTFTLPGGTQVLDVPDLGDQVGQFIAASDAGLLTTGANPLAALWFGGNDMRDAFLAADPQVAVQTAIVNAVSAIVAGTGALLGEGLGHVVVFGLPDLGMIPQTLAKGQASMTAATGATIAFNDTLQTALASTFGANVSYFDMFGLFQEVTANPTDFGFSNTADPCVAALIAGFVSDCSGYLFYDDIHPTQAAHAIIAQRFATAVAPVPLPAAGILLLGGLGGLALLWRRRGAAA